MKHALVVLLVRALQKKEKGFLFLDTHAGRGAYDLTRAATGDTLARQPEWPAGIGRLWARTDLPPVVADYEALVREFDAREGNLETAPRYYPGSPSLARLLARPQDRMVFCELQPAECTALKENFDFERRASVQALDGYVAPRAMLPPPEKRALVLIDPPFESQDEWARIVGAVKDGLARLPAGVFAVWYPLTERARVNEFFGNLRALDLPPTLVAELAVAGDDSPMKMKGCGLVVLNPPWQFDREATTTMDFLAEALAQSPGGWGRVSWLVEEK